jgi:hypothetical protein
MVVNAVERVQFPEFGRMNTPVCFTDGRRHSSCFLSLLLDEIMSVEGSSFWNIWFFAHLSLELLQGLSVSKFKVRVVCASIVEWSTRTWLCVRLERISIRSREAREAFIVGSRALERSPELSIWISRQSFRIFVFTRAVCSEGNFLSRIIVERKDRGSVALARGKVLGLDAPRLRHEICLVRGFIPEWSTWIGLQIILVSDGQGLT